MGFSYVVNVGSPFGDCGSPLPWSRFSRQIYRSSSQSIETNLKPECFGEKTNRVNFCISSEMWVVKCIRDGRPYWSFLRKMVNTIPELTIWRCTISRYSFDFLFSFLFIAVNPLLMNARISWLYHFVFVDDFTSYIVYDSSCKPNPDQNHIALVAMEDICQICYASSLPSEFYVLWTVIMNETVGSVDFRWFYQIGDLFSIAFDIEAPIGGKEYRVGFNCWAICS